MQFCLDQPRDRLITERVQVLSGWVAPECGEFALQAVCGDRPILLRRFDYPDPSRRLTGFWALLFLQELLDSIDQGFLAIDLLWERHLVQRLYIRVSPVARELAEAYPLNLEVYPTGFGPRSPEAPYTLVFPGLGGVGGSTINLLMRTKMYREDWPFPVYSEANDGSLWKELRPKRPAPRWIDGHDCYLSADSWPGGFARITLLREPLRRLVSVFNYNSIVHPKEFPFANFEDFIFSEQVGRYCQASGLLRAAGRSIPADVGPDELFTLARDELDRNYRLVGITELFEETVFMICRLAGYRDINMWWRVLSAPSSVEIGRLPSHVRHQAESVLAADQRLYREKKAEFETCVREAALGEPLMRYKRDASEERPLPESYKMIECLRWRQVIQMTSHTSDEPHE